MAVPRERGVQVSTAAEQQGRCWGQSCHRVEVHLQRAEGTADRQQWRAPTVGVELASVEALEGRAREFRGSFFARKMLSEFIGDCHSIAAWTTIQQTIGRGEQICHVRRRGSG